MGVHAFQGEPEHCLVYRRNLGDDLPGLRGTVDGWNMPVARHRRDIGQNVRFDGVGHYILTYHVGGAAARRTDEVSGRVARAGALSLQAPMSGATISTEGVVDYAHLYFNQGLLCEVLDEVSDPENPAVPEDFFAMTDAPLAGDIDSYLARALDTADTATALEMDSRSYLIALGVIRVGQRNNLALRLRENLDVRADLKRVVGQIDDRLGEPLRLSDLAAIVDMSPFHFARIFKAQVGEPPAQYVQRRRTERAVAMLKETDLALSEIAFRTGFSSQSHMNRRVKQMTGLTPRQVRKGE